MSSTEQVEVIEFEGKEIEEMLSEEGLGPSPPLSLSIMTLEALFLWRSKTATEMYSLPQVSFDLYAFTLVT